MWPWWCPVYRWRELVAGADMEQENLSARDVRPVKWVRSAPWSPRGRTLDGESTDPRHRGGPARNSDEGPVMGLERRGRAGQVNQRPTLLGRSRWRDRS
jgi:hypothetical protein